MAERTWPENAYPTPEQLADWLLTVDREVLVDRCQSFIEDMQMAATCFEQNHVGRIARAERTTPTTETRESAGESEADHG